MRHGTDDFTSPPKEGVLRIFSAGFEPAILGTRGQHANHKTTEAALGWMCFRNVYSIGHMPTEVNGAPSSWMTEDSSYHKLQINHISQHVQEANHSTINKGTSLCLAD